MLRGAYSIWISSGAIYACKMSMICKVNRDLSHTKMKAQCCLDAAERLMKCDTCFVKVYGNSFQRLKALQKDGMGHMVLFVRLHLLQVIRTDSHHCLVGESLVQAIVAYHAGRKVDAKNFLNMADEEARMMRVDPEKLTQSEDDLTLKIKKDFYARV